MGKSRGDQSEAAEAPAGGEPCGTAAPSAFVIFGASGDLTRRKLVPALWRLHARGKLPERLAIVGFARTAKSDEAFRQEMRAGCQAVDAEGFDAARWPDFAGRLSYVTGSYDSAEDFRRLDETLRRFQAGAAAAACRVYYLATPASAYAAIIENAGRLPAAGGERRIVLEKPFGRDLAEARRLNQLLAAHFDERRTFRIDHYLGKETVQNILILRFTNAIFEPLWNRQHIARVEIAACETLGVEGRGGFYEQSGALRDMVQMHLLQLLALVALEQPASFAAEDIRDEKAKVLRALRPIAAEEVRREALRGQYGPGRAGGREVLGYRQEPGVAPDSNVETYVALRAWIDNWRWQGVPFHLQTGKRLQRHATEIAIHFHEVPTCLFSQRELCLRLEPNVLVLRIQPREGVHLELSSKVPGDGGAVVAAAEAASAVGLGAAALNVGRVRLDFDYAEVFGLRPPEAYETLLVDLLAGDPALFARRDQVELAWQYLEPVLDVWSATPPEDFPNYAAGSRGPRAAEALRQRKGW